MKKAQVFLIAAAGMILNPASLGYGQILYEVIDLGKGTAYSINNNGQVVGSLDNYGAFLYDTVEDRRVILGPGTPRSINDNGQIVGRCIYDPTGGGNNKLLTGSASSINNSGQVVGTKPKSLVPAPVVPTVAVLFDPAGNGNDIQLSGAFSSNAAAIDNRGQIVGSELYNGHSRQAVLFDSAGQLNNIRLGQGQATSINDNGQIIGWDSYLNAGGASEAKAILYDATGNGNNVNLGLGIAYSINDNEQIVGYRMRVIGYEHEAEGVLFNPTGNGNNIALNNLIDPSSGWDLHVAYAINDNGWIVGYGSHGNTYTEAFLLKPIPEPAALLLLGVGGMMLRRVKGKS